MTCSNSLFTTTTFYLSLSTTCCLQFKVVPSQCWWSNQMISVLQYQCLLIFEFQFLIIFPKSNKRNIVQCCATLKYDLKLIHLTKVIALRNTFFRPQNLYLFHIVCKGKPLTLTLRCRCTRNCSCGAASLKTNATACSCWRLAQWVAALTAVWEAS